MAFAELIGVMQASTPGPLYQQLERKIREAIHEKKLSPGDALPPERELANQLSVSRITVRKALDILVAEGLLTRQHGTGTFVASRVEKNFSKLSSFTEDMKSRGRVPNTKWLSRTVGAVTPAESLTLSLSPGSPVYRFSRIRFADGAPMALEYATIPAFCLPSIDALEASLYEALERFDFRPVRALQRLRAILFNAEQAALLNVVVGAPGLSIERHGFLKDGRIVEVTHSFYRGDAYDFVAELSSPG